jgi:hypothetical protein
MAVLGNKMGEEILSPLRIAMRSSFVAPEICFVASCETERASCKADMLSSSNSAFAGHWRVMIQNSVWAVFQYAMDMAWKRLNSVF